MIKRSKLKGIRQEGENTIITIGEDTIAIRLSPFERGLLSVITKLKFTHSSVLRIHLRTNRFKVNQGLQTLWKNGLIHRDIQGLVISTQAAEEDAELKAFIEKSFKTHLT